MVNLENEILTRSKHRTHSTSATEHRGTLLGMQPHYLRVTLGFEVVGNGRWWGGWGGVSWDEYFFLFGTVYLHWGVVLNSPGVKCDNVIKGLFWCESCNPESTRGSLSSLRSSADRGARIIQAEVARQWRSSMPGGAGKKRARSVASSAACPTELAE